MGNYGKLSPGNLCYLFRSYCCAFYGSQLWDFNSHGFKSICIQWNKAVRKIMKLHYRTHVWLLGPLTSQRHLSVQLYVKALRFINYMLNSSNDVVAYIGKMVSSDARSPIGGNAAYLRHTCNVNFDLNVVSNIDRIVKKHVVTEYQQSIVNVINDLTDSSAEIDGFSSEMREDIMFNLCVEWLVHNHM